MVEIFACRMDQRPQKKWEAKANLGGAQPSAPLAPSRASSGGGGPGVPPAPRPSPVDLRQHLLLDARLLLVRRVPAPPRVLREVVPDEMQLGGEQWAGTRRGEGTPALPPSCSPWGGNTAHLLLPAGVVLQGSLVVGPGAVRVVVGPLAEVVPDVKAAGEGAGGERGAARRGGAAPRGPAPTGSCSCCTRSR